MGVIFISNTGGGSKLPANSVVLSDGNAFTGFNLKDYGGYYIAPSNVNGSTGGFSTHTHTHTMTVTSAGSHTHSFSGEVGACNGSVEFNTNGPNNWNYPTPSHKHNITLGARTSGGGGHTHAYSGMDSAANTPPYQQLVAYKTLSETDLPNGAIIMWYGGTLPPQFKKCDGTGETKDMQQKYLKLGNSVSSGGVSTHSHTTGSFVASGAHTHSYEGLVDNSPGYTKKPSTVVSQAALDGVHQHWINITTNATGEHTHGRLNTSSNSASPSSTKIYFAKYDSSLGDGVVPGVVVITEAGSIPSGWSELSTKVANIYNKPLQGLLYSPIYSSPQIYTAPAHSHTVSATTTDTHSDNGHTHNNGSTTLVGTGDNKNVYNGASPLSGGGRQAHTHAVSYYIGETSFTHSHPISVTVNQVASANITPPYKTVILIVKD